MGCDWRSSPCKGCRSVTRQTPAQYRRSPLPERNTSLPVWENLKQAKSWERLHKESGHLSKEWAALSGERDVRADTRQGLPRQGAIEWFPLKSPALCFSDEVDNAQTITVLGVLYVLAVAPSLWGWGGTRGGNSFHLIWPEELYLKWGKVAELSDVFFRTPTLQRGRNGESSLAGLKPRLHRYTFFFFPPPKKTNGIRPGLNSDGVYTFRPI